MNIRRLVTVIVFLSLVFMACRPMIDTDTWWHMRTGQWILDHGELPRVDRFSFSRLDETWYYPGWLAETLMVKVFSAAGLTGLNLLFSVVFLLAFVILYSTQDGNPFLKGAVFILAAGVSEIYWSARPHAFTFLFSACFYVCLRRFLEGKGNLLWILPPIMVIWVNTHAGFAVGFLMLLAAVIGQGVKFLICRPPRPPEMASQFIWLTGVILACLVGSAVNPYGFTILAYPFQTVSIEFLQKFILEWKSPDFHYWQAQLFLILFFAAWAAIAFSPKAMDLVDFCFLILFGYMGFLAWRNTNLLSIIAPAIILRYAQPLLEKGLPAWNPDHPVSKLQSALHILAATAIAATVLFFGISSLSPSSLQATVRRDIPVDAVEYLAAHPIQGRMFNSYNWGSYLLWNLPSQPVFVDGRTDLYDDEILGQYLAVVSAQAGWQDILEQWDIQYVFLEPSTPIVGILLSEGWTEYYQDAQAVILVRPES